MLEQLLESLLKPRQAFSAKDWAHIKSAEFDSTAAFEEHIRHKGMELTQLCREHGIPCVFFATLADNHSTTTSAVLMGSGIAEGSDANPMSRTTMSQLLCYAMAESRGTDEAIEHFTEILAAYAIKRELGNH